MRIPSLRSNRANDAFPPRVLRCSRAALRVVHQVKAATMPSANMSATRDATVVAEHGALARHRDTIDECARTSVPMNRVGMRSEKLV